MKLALPRSVVALCVTWGTLGLLLAVAVRHIALFASPFPRWDDLGWIDAISPRLSVDPAWLWASYNDHRLPLPRSIGVPIVRFAGDLRAAMYFGVLLQASAAAVLMLALRAVRGRTEWVDAAFPMLLLSPASGALFLQLQGITYTVPIALFCAALALLSTARGAPSPRRSLALGACTIGLPLCGGPGLTAVPALLVWTSVAAWSLRRSSAPAERVARRILWASTASTLLVVALYFVDFERQSGAAWNPSFRSALLEAWKFQAGGLGVVASRAWPWSGALAAAAGILALWASLRAWRRAQDERLRVLALAAVALASLSMAAAIGIGRSGPGYGAGFEPRYVSLAALWWCSILALLLVQAPRLGRVVAASVCVLLLGALPAHLRFLHAEGRRNQEVTDLFALDVARGASVRELASRFPNCFAWGAELFARKLEALQQFGLWPGLERYARRRASAIGTEKISPQWIESAQPLAYRWFEGRFVLVGALDHALGFPCPREATRLRGSFAVHAAAIEALDVEGVRLSIELPGPSPTLLYERTFLPRTTLADRGFQTFAVDLPPGRGVGPIVLRAAHAGPAGKLPALAMWTELGLD